MYTKGIGRFAASLILRVLLRRLAFIVFLFPLLGFGQSQMLDDSTELVYGPHSTKIIYESDLKMNTGKQNDLDTGIYFFENFTYVDKFRRHYQDLGNNGTAMFPVFYDLPNLIGRRSGFNAYDIYIKSPENFKYYNTKSPFTDVVAMFGQQSRNMVDFQTTRNVNPNWNVGVDLHRIISDKQIGAVLNEGDRNVVSSTYDIYTYYEHPKVPYKVMFHALQFSHEVDETGGIYVVNPDSVSRADLFEYRDSDIQLNDANYLQKRSRFHLYHEYALFKQFQLYHQFDRERARHSYVDNIGGANYTYIDYYDQFLIDEDSTHELYNWREMTNELGLKGSISSVYYRFYIKQRGLDFRYLYYDPIERQSESYIGGITEFRWKDKLNVSGQVEFQDEGAFKLVGSLTSPFFNASYKSIRYHPSILSQDYFGNHYEWHNSFDFPFANEISGNINMPIRGFLLSPSLRLTTLGNYIYYDRDKQPEQFGSTALITRIGAKINYSLITQKERGEGFHIENEGYFTDVDKNASSFIRIPTWFYNGRFFFRGLWFENAVPVEVGFNIHARSSYAPNQYDPVTQQFYVQDRKINGYYTIDPFITLLIERISIFLKVTHVNQPAGDGYFVTPFYPGQQRSLDLGVRWIFFD